MIAKPVIHLETSCFQVKRKKAKQTPRMVSVLLQINPPPQKNIPEWVLLEEMLLYLEKQMIYFF